jgi:hypothetical protein
MKRIGIAAAVLVVGASTMQAQTTDPQCTGNTADACQKAIDLFKYLAPQLGTTIAGGNTIMGQGGVLGGLPHWTAGVRITLDQANIPQFTSGANFGDPTVTSPKSTPYTTSTSALAFPAVDGAVGVFGGLPLGLTKIGGVDLLVNVAYVPTVTTGSFSVTPQTNLKFGGGLRVGLLQESLLVPGVSVSAIRRGLPKTTITATTTSGSSSTDSLQISNLDLNTTSYRLTVSKSLIIFGLAAGVGMDKYDESTDVSVALHRSVLGIPQRFANATPFHASSTMTRTNAFGDVYINLLLLKIVGEVGVASGGTATTFNTFDKSATAARPYGAVGLRVGF